MSRKTAQLLYDFRHIFWQHNYMVLADDLAFGSFMNTMVDSRKHPYTNVGDIDSPFMAMNNLDTDLTLWHNLTYFCKYKQQAMMYHLNSDMKKMFKFEEAIENAELRCVK
mmetsp:Transcript_28753/g.31932  ORF Transcript_28753/g.31932 Transcript_28753/m.31932 type:complete len:110 (-) Transcript_28753:27-356(-)